MMRAVASGVMLASLLVAGPPAAGAASFDQDPVLFVHGIEGSGAQFESQKMRFMSNGYPERWIDAVDYDSTRAVGDKSQVHAQIDEAIAELKQDTGRSEVDVVAHSLGTSVMYEYFTEGSMATQRKASVDRYINVDGQSSHPGLPTLAVWAGRGTPDRTMEGAANVTVPNQTHVQACTSAEAFVEYYRFLTGNAPDRDIVPETGPVSIAGRALVFPQNTGLPAGVTLEIWPVDDATGQRSASAPVARVALDESGDFGPVQVETGRRYEFVLLKAGVTTLHYYYEPFVRSDYLIRLPYSDAIEALVQRSERHVSGLVIRYKELWGDQDAQNDVLSFNDTNVCNAVICPISKQVNALFFYDRGADGRTDLSSPDPAFSRLPFITGVDIFLAAARPPDGTVSVSLQSRGGGPARTLSFPNFASTTDGAVLQFNDFELVNATPPAPVRLRFTARVKSPVLASRPSRTGRRIRLRIRKTAVEHISHLVLEYRRTGRGTSRKYKSLRPRLKPTTKRVWFRKGRIGQTYLFRIRAVGKTGIRTDWDHSRTVYPYDDLGKGRRYSAGWSRVMNKRAWQGAYSQTSRRGATLRFRTKGGGRVYLIGPTGPNGGKAVFGRGTKKRVVSFKSKRHRNRRVVAVLNRTPNQVYRFKLKVLRGTVTIDGIGVRRR